MVNKKTEKRVVNIPKPEFDAIKKYCDDNALSMPKWLVKIAREKITIKEI